MVAPAGNYTWVKRRRQEAALVPQAKARGAHRKRRERSPWPELMIHQDGSRHEGVAGQKWDLIVTMDDATNEPYSMFFVEEEDTMSSLQGVREVIELLGLFSTFYSDRGSHYWPTPEAGGKVDQQNLTPFGQAMKHLGIEMIADCSPEARGRSERMFRTHQDRLPRELALVGITDRADANRDLTEVYRSAFNAEFMQPAMEEGSDFVDWMPRELALVGITDRADANRDLTEVYRSAFNAEFMQPAMEEGSDFVDWIGGPLGDILCERFERTVGNDHCVRFEGMKLQIPADRHRCHHVKAKVAVLRRTDHTLAILHGPRKLADYDEAGKVMPPNLKVAAYIRRGRPGQSGQFICYKTGQFYLLPTLDWSGVRNAPCSGWAVEEGDPGASEDAV